MNDKIRKAEQIKKQLDEANARKKKIFGWVKFGVQLWAIRMAFAMFGMTIPFAINLYNEWFPVDYSIQYTTRPASVSWFDVVKSEFKLAMKARIDGAPLLITEVPLISSLALRMFMEKSLPISTIQAKISSQNVFVHYSADQLWSRMYNVSKQYEYVSLAEYNSEAFRATRRFPPYSHLDQLRDDSFDLPSSATAGECSSDPASGAVCPSPDSQLHFMYSTVTPLPPSSVSSLCPSLAHLHYSQSTDPQASLWLSSPGSSAALHFDMEDNFLLQLAGSKTLLLVAPEALHCLRPHSSLHPHWRQSQLGRLLVTARDVYETLHSQEEEEGEEQQQQHGSISGCFNRTSNTAPLLWQVDMRAGDLVYIPAGFFHAVTAGSDSLSLNSWFASSMSEAYASLLNAHLPFDTAAAAEPLGTKLACLSALVRKLIKHHALLPSYERFVSSLRGRYTPLVRDKETFPCSRDRVEPVCAPRDLQTAETSRLVVRASNSVYSLLTTHTRLSEGVVTLLLLDYIEEVVQTVVQPSSELTPCWMLSFANQCF